MKPRAMTHIKRLIWDETKRVHGYKEAKYEQFSTNI